MLKNQNRTNKQNTRNTKPSYNINWNVVSNKEVKFAEVTRSKNTYYAFGKNRDTGKVFPLDVEAKYRGEAKAWLDTEFNAMNADLVSEVRVYQ